MRDFCLTNLMGSSVHCFSMLLLFIPILGIAARTSSLDFAALDALKQSWKNTPANWVGSDPCGDSWVGIGCTGGRVTSITLSSMGLTGQLTSDLASLSELQALDLSYNTGLMGSVPPSIGRLKKLSNLILAGCSFSGPIPDTIGSLGRLVYLTLNSNRFGGTIPPSIGRLKNLYWLDLAGNQLSGTIPVSNGSTPGLDLLVNTKHFHFGMNKISGTIPPQLFNPDMTLIHVLFDSNRLTGVIPSTIGLVQSLEVIRFDRNSLSGTLPSNLNNLTGLAGLFLSNNRLTGSIPNLTGMNYLAYVDMSNNSFGVSAVPQWFSSLQSLTTLIMESTQLQGQIPVTLFSLPALQNVDLKNNQINGTLDIGTSYNNNLRTINFQDNSIDGFTQRSEFNFELILLSNPVCADSAPQKYCKLPTQSSNSSFSTPPINCVPVLCTSNQTCSPNCKCAYPYTGTLIFRAPSFSNIDNSFYYTSLEKALMFFFQSNHFPVDSVSLSNPAKDSSDYLKVNLQVFPSIENSFNGTAVSTIAFMLSSQTFKPPELFGPFFFIGQIYSNFYGSSTQQQKSSNTGIIAGIAAGISVLVLLLLCAGFYALRLKRQAMKATGPSDPFASWNPTKAIGSSPQLKGARNFSFEELKKCTDNFSEANSIGSGGYGKVYRGTLANGQLVAIKRALQDSLQGGLEFKTEIELLSRVHHKNVVSLLGFCFELGEQILVYEFVPNGSLNESLSGKQGIHLDWMKRLKVALGSARGLAYLHELADPPIIHRDIKSNNILLDERLIAKVADFGLSKPMDDSRKDHITTQVKGTMGYLDPEYYMTQRLTEKSDVYSFGIVLLELLTARAPISGGTYIVRVMRKAMDKTKYMYGLGEILDPVMITGSLTLEGLERFVDVAMRCVEESGDNRPTMGEVVKEIESIMELAGLNPKAESASTSASYEVVSKDNSHLLHPYVNESKLFHYSGGFPSSSVEPH